MTTPGWRVCLGIVRPYSLVDLLFFLSLLPMPARERLGLVLLWIGFLFWCEAIHNDREQGVHGWLVIACWLPGICFVPPLLALGFLALSVLYSLKIHSYLGILAPFVRGSQNFLIGAWYLGTTALISQLAFRLITCRNLVGDFRDLTKDGRRGLKTIPTVLNFQTAWPAWTHLGMVMLTTAVWWSLGQLGIGWLILAWLIQITSYHWTPR